MIHDLLAPITEATILVICTEQLDSIVNLLNSNNYQNAQCSHNLPMAMEKYRALSPDLIIVSPSVDLSLSDFSDNLNSLDAVNPIPPVLLINDSLNHVPGDPLVKDFLITHKPQPISVISLA